MQGLEEKETTLEDVYDEYSHCIGVVEEALGAHVDEEYNLIKFWNQYDEVVWRAEQEEKERKRRSRTKTLR